MRKLTRSQRKMAMKRPQRRPALKIHLNLLNQINRHQRKNRKYLNLKAEKKQPKQILKLKENQRNRKLSNKSNKSKPQKRTYPRMLQKKENLKLNILLHPRKKIKRVLQKRKKRKNPRTSKPQN